MIYGGEPTASVRLRALTSLHLS